jgi:hypothetical protein
MFSYETYRKVKIHDDTINCMMIDQNILFTGGYDSTIKLTVIIFILIYSLFKHFKCLYVYQHINNQLLKYQ